MKTNQTTRELLLENPRRPRKHEGQEHKSGYRTRVMAGLVMSLSAMLVLVRLDFSPANNGMDFILVDQETVQMEEIVQTTQELKAPPPPRPPVPIEVPDDFVFEEEELDLDATLDLDAALSDLPPPPPMPATPEPEADVETEIFVVVEQMPTIIGGAQKVYEYLEYPEIARQAGLEGLVVVQLVVTPDGLPSLPEVARSSGQVLDEAAVRAVMKLTFEPGMQRGRAVRVRMAIPIRFRLRDAAKK